MSMRPVRILRYSVRLPLIEEFFCIEVRIGEYLMVASEESSIYDVSAVHLLSHISNINTSAGQYSSLAKKTISPT